MVEQNEWVFFEDIEWDCSNNNKFNVDTRDFRVGYYFDAEPHKDFDTLKKYPDFFYTEEELKTGLNRLYVESGGKGEWRMLSLVSNDARVLNWRLKYIRIWRTYLGFIICNSENVAIRKNLLAKEVNQEYLHHH